MPKKRNLEGGKRGRTSSEIRNFASVLEFKNKKKEFFKKG